MDCLLTVSNLYPSYLLLSLTGWFCLYDPFLFCISS